MGSYAKQDGAWKEILPSGFLPMATDLIVSADRTQRVIYAKNLTISANCTITCDFIICEGDFKVNSGVTVTFKNTITNAAQATPTSWSAAACLTSPWVKSGTGATGSSGGVAWGARLGEAVSGGSSLAAKGGVGDALDLSKNPGNPAVWPGSISVGGQGGYGVNDASNYGGGGGAGPGGAGGGTPAVAGGAGGATIFLLVKGNFTLESGSLINLNGSNGSTSSGQCSGGGAGGCFCLLCFGTYTNSGNINMKGGSPGSWASGHEGGGGGGGHIEIFAKTSSFGSYDVGGGATLGYGGQAGFTGTNSLVDISSETSRCMLSYESVATVGLVAGMLLSELGGQWWR